MHRSVAAIIKNEKDEILMLDRKNFPFGWACPAGHIEEAETPEEALQREVKEETGLDVKNYMKIEYEATFTNVDKNEIREKLKKAGAKLIRPEFLQKRCTFNLPKGHEIKGGWLRVRDEGDKITMTLKVVDGDKIENQKEVTLSVDNFEQAELFLNSIGCHEKSYQETKRELWELDEAEIMIDEWPFLEPFVEIEGKSEEAVMEASKKLGFDYSQALFCSITTLYHQKYGVLEEVINNEIPEITFDGKNPFVKS